MKRLKSAFQAGQEGKELGHGSARRLRAANGLGRLIGRKGQEKVGPNEAQFSQYLESLNDIAVGANKAAVEVIQTSSQLLGIYADDPVELKVSANPQKFEWRAGFCAGASKGPDNKHLTPLVELPQLMVDGKMIKVDNITVSASTMVAEDRFTPPETALAVNSWPSNTDNPADTLLINVLSDGKIVFESGHPSPGESNVEAFIEGVAACVERTAGAYARVQELDPQNFVR